MEAPDERAIIDANMRELARGLSENCAVFIALGDENRQRILAALLEHYGGLRAGEIARLVGLSRPAVSHHLKTLAEAGLVETETENGIVRLYPTEAGIRVSELLDEISSVIGDASGHPPS